MILKVIDFVINQRTNKNALKKTSSGFNISKEVKNKHKRKSSNSKKNQTKAAVK